MSKVSKAGRANRTQAGRPGKRGFDRRLTGHPGGATPKEFAKALAALPDVAEEGEWIDAPQKAEATDEAEADAGAVPGFETPAQ